MIAKFVTQLSRKFPYYKHLGISICLILYMGIGVSVILLGVEYQASDSILSDMFMLMFLVNETSLFLESFSSV